MAAMTLPIDRVQPLVIIVMVAIRAFLQTGLFIIAHDAMHGSLANQQPRLNQQIGSFCLLVYAGLSFAACQSNHKRHHLAPATRTDPDFGGSRHQSVISWYLNFLSNYLSIQQLLRLGMIWTFLYFIANQCSTHPASHVALFCIVPLVLSSWQLFLVGTYLPHRKTDPHKGDQPRSLYLPAILSFASCYHFGYHREHHENPSVPWFKLPHLRTDDRRRRSDNLNLLQA